MNEDEKTRIRQIAQAKIDEFMKGDEHCQIYGPYVNPHNGGRKQVVIVEKLGEITRRRTVSWPKLIAEILTDGMLPEGMTVDHIDRDFTNDDVFNLRVLTQSLHSSEDSVRVSRSDVDCPECGKRFRPTRFQCDKRHAGRAGPFCSRNCAGKYGAAVQNGAPTIEKTSVMKTLYRPTKVIR